ncbi:MAG TPA: rhodanese-like domain-containing protein [Polyangiales bacterium]|jgi:rhodanese-related sulfurtransferase
MKRTISPEAAANALREQSAVYIDVRTVVEFELGHPEGAYNVPWSLARDLAGELNREFVPLIERHFRRHQRLIIGCQSGVRSAPASAALIAAGFEEVFEQRAGYGGRRDPFGRSIEPGWERSGLPTSTEAIEGRSYDALRSAMSARS